MKEVLENMDIQTNSDIKNIHVKSENNLAHEDNGQVKDNGAGDCEDNAMKKNITQVFEKVNRNDLSIKNIQVKSEDNSQKCHICDKTFGSLQHLKIHNNGVHKGFYDHFCDKCDKAFSQAKELKAHFTNVCKKDKAFNQAKKLKTHVTNVCKKDTTRNNVGDLNQNIQNIQANYEGISSKFNILRAFPQFVQQLSQTNLP